jgi:hypothetical protein
MGGFWPGIYVVKKAMHGTYISYCRLQTRSFWHFTLQRPLFFLYSLRKVSFSLLHLEWKNLFGGGSG